LTLLTRALASFAALFMFWLSYALSAIYFWHQIPYGYSAWLLEPLYTGLRLPVFAAIAVVAFVLVGFMLFDYAITGELRL